MDHVGQVALVLRRQVDAPLDGKLELHFLRRDVLSEDLDRLGVRHASEAGGVSGSDGLQPLPGARSGHRSDLFTLFFSTCVVFEEIQLGGAVRQSFADAEGNKVLCAPHVIA